MYRSRLPLTTPRTVDLVPFTALLFDALVLLLVQDDRADYDSSLDDLLPVCGHVGQVQGVVEHADDERAHDGPRDGPDPARGKGRAADDRG